MLEVAQQHNSGTILIKPNRGKIQVATDRNQTPSAEGEWYRSEVKSASIYTHEHVNCVYMCVGK